MKSTLTSGVVTTEFFFQEEDGTRRKKIIENLVIGTNWGATNTGRRGIGEAMLSRFMHFPMNIKTSKKRSIAACKQAERSKTAEDRERDARFAYECRWRQAAVWIVEKMIHTHLLPEPEMYAAVQIFDRLGKGIRKERGETAGRVHPRNIERCMIYARLFTIINAIEHTFFVPSETCSPTTEDAELEDFLDIAPYLVCTEEIALFTFTMLREQFFQPCDFLPHIHTIWKENPQFKTIAKTRTLTNAQQDAFEYDYNYIKIPMSPKQLALRINLLMPEETGKSSIVDIEVSLTAMASQSIKGPRWSEHAADGEACTLPKTILSHKACYVNRTLLQQKSNSGLVYRVMNYARSRYTEPQKIITAISAPDAQPHVLNTVDWTPQHSDAPLRVDNYLFVAPEEEQMLGFTTQREPTTTVQSSFEDIAFRRARQPRIKRARYA